MSDADWGDAGAAPKRRRIPTWVWWGCGGGCLLLVLIVVGFVALATKLWKEGTDPERQWPRLGEVLAFDERPAGLDLRFAVPIPVDQFHLYDRVNDLTATVVEYPSAASSDYRQLLDPEFELPLGLGKLVEPELGTLAIQGREVPALRFARLDLEPEEDGPGAGIRVDLTGERSKPRTLELRHAGAERIEDAEVQAFLAPFDVWREP